MGPSPKWELLIVVYFFLGGIAAGSYFLAVLADLFGGEGDRPVARLGYRIAFPVSLVLPLLLVADLGTPLRAFNMFLEFKLASPMSVGSWGLLGFTLFSFLSWRLALKADEDAATLGKRRSIGLVGGIFGFFIASYTGVLLSTSAMPVWGDSTLIGMLFLLSGASSAIAVMTLGLQSSGALEHKLWKRLSKLDEIILGMEILVFATFIATMGDSSSVFLTGRYSLLFWVFAIAGLIIPALLQAAAIYTPFLVPASARVISTASSLVVIGGFVMRYLIVYAAQA